MRPLISLFTPRRNSNTKWRLPLGHLSGRAALGLCFEPRQNPAKLPALETLISHLVRATFPVSYCFSKPVIYSTFSPPLQVGKLVGLLFRWACLYPRR